MNNNFRKTDPTPVDENLVDEPCQEEDFHIKLESTKNVQQNNDKNSEIFQQSHSNTVAHQNTDEQGCQKE